VEADPTAPSGRAGVGRLADYAGAAWPDLTPVLRSALNKLGPWPLDDTSVRRLLWAKNMDSLRRRPDRLNELRRADVEDGAQPSAAI
jgi:hypothetical protein